MNWYKYFEKNKTCAFIAAWLPKSFYDKYSHIDDLGDDLHMTLLYIEDFEDEEGDREKIFKAVENVTKKYAPIKCETTEIGAMGNDDKTLVVNIAVDNGAAFYSDLVSEVEKQWKEFDREFDFLPHVSLNYEIGEKEIDSKEFKDFSWTINRISVSFNHDNDDKTWFSLNG